MTQGILAKKAQISVPYLSQLEQGKRDPTLSALERIANSLEVPLNILFFLGAERDEIDGMKPELAEKLSHLALQLLDEK
jgi:transcriptional regulator with XRE-family HTH domain